MAVLERDSSVIINQFTHRASFVYVGNEHEVPC